MKWPWVYMSSPSRSPLPLGLPRAPGPSACLMHPTWAGDLFHPWWYTCFDFSEFLNQIHKPQRGEDSSSWEARGVQLNVLKGPACKTGLAGPWNCVSGRKAKRRWVTRKHSVLAFPGQSSAVLIPLTEWTVSFTHRSHSKTDNLNFFYFLLLGKK